MLINFIGHYIVRHMRFSFVPLTAFVLCGALLAASVTATVAEAKTKSKKARKTSSKKIEKFSGTVDDGTTEEIHALADIESGKVDEELDSLKPAKSHSLSKVEVSQKSLLQRNLKSKLQFQRKNMMLCRPRKSKKFLSA